ncbi:ABC transporter substrate-binding protein [Pararhizobium sp. YC-54]|uniref:ABC transporter substrate-binding protein n=1 Tax=Pararhizobium sp. YC-54 TaxID=2986920 RepID=UPI0021F6BB37|nr:ABC transporter substrate-binding protein [Pararhizobium sp. YC-54]MCW0002368.1 ABC transporter substrate-binding protein [Pararhizobium sp. YC-54]
MIISLALCAAAPRKRVATRLLLAVLSIMTFAGLAGCQGATQDVLDLESPQAREARRAAAHPAVPQETLGNGPTRVGLITAIMAPGGPSRRERDIRDGAALAVHELASTDLSLLVENTDGSQEQMRDAAKLLGEQGVKLVAVSVANEPVGLVRDALGTHHVPLLILRADASGSSPDTFYFTSDRVDSAVEGASYAVASGRAHLIVLTPSDLTARERQRLDRGLSSYNIKPVLVETSTATFAGEGASAAKINDIDAVLLIGATDGDVGGLSRLRANGYLKPNAAVIGSSNWASAGYKRPELAGSKLCLFGPEGGSRMTKAYLQRYERTAGEDAAYGFDIIALTAGLVRAHGPDGITVKNIRSPSGFLGAAAAFRFEADGSVRRTCSIYDVQSGGLKLIDPAPRSF